MSLINDALKKAQRQRTEGTTPPTEVSSPAAAPEQLQRVTRREKPAGFRSQLMLIGGGAVAAVALLGIGAVFFFRSAEQPATTPAAPAPAPVAVAPAQTVTPSVTQTTPAPTRAPVTPALTVALPPTQSPAPETTPAQVTVAAPAPAATAPLPPATGQFVLPAPPAAEPAQVAASTPSAPAATVADRPKPSTRMIGVIERFRVGGIRVAGAESKVLMNDKVYRINDTVDHELGIRLTAIETKALTFEDSRGAVHTRTF